MAYKNTNYVRCPKCTERCINHRVFTSTRVADYSNGKNIRFYRCGPIEKEMKHEEHEWQVGDIKVGAHYVYPELGDHVFLNETMEGWPEISVEKKKEKTDIVKNDS